MESRSREMRVELKNVSKEEVLVALRNFLETQTSGRMGFEKEGESFSVVATSEHEPTSS